ncbi:uncharacterized protein LOC114726666 [Neltuma alba]|uniref:uncharacterized protein LOC114726666 n=1 Tax=Neltuma alba TaxID=207710 RepID=UPI0010A4C37A|nr:uncharacterized protein LOC114726666 [Prosopis alba]
MSSSPFQGACVLSSTIAEATKRYAVVTGANKGIGFAICKQLASNGVRVVLTARDPKNGLEAVEKLGSEFGASGQVDFHQLDVNDSASASSLANFITTKFAKLDILVNNAGVAGLHIDRNALAKGTPVDWRKVPKQTYESAEATIRTNYYGAKQMCEALIPLLQLSDSPRIVNVSSSLGRLENIPSGWSKEVLNDAESLTEEKLDEVLEQFLEDFKEGSLETKGWPTDSSVYTMSKAALNAYTRILANKHPSICINAVCPGYVRTDLSSNTGYLTADEGAQSVARVALLPNGAHSGVFFNQNQVASFWLIEGPSGNSGQVTFVTSFKGHVSLWRFKMLSHPLPYLSSCLRHFRFLKLWPYCGKQVTAPRKIPCAFLVCDFAPRGLFFNFQRACVLRSQMAEAAKRYAVVTGGNKGIGFGICKQLACNGIVVVLTARDQKKGLDAVEKLGSEFGVSGEVVFHQLDVTDPASVSSLANFIRNKFGKLDILVNNAGITGAHVDRDGLIASVTAREKGTPIDWSKIITQDYESAEAGIRTNYYGAKEMCLALIPLLELSDSPRIVNVSSSMGKLENIPSGWAKEVLSDAENLTEEKLDEVMKQFLEDVKQGSLETKGFSVYIVSKACMNAYTRILAKKYPSFYINAVCPGFVKTDINYNTGHLTVDEGAESVVRLALLPHGGHSGLFFIRSDVASF